MRILAKILITLGILGMATIAYAQFSDGGPGFDLRAFIHSAGSNLQLNDDIQLILGTGSDTIITYDTAETPDAAVVGLGTDSRILYLMEAGDIASDLARAQQTNPTLHIHAADAATTTKYLELSNNGTNSVLTTGIGAFSLNSKALFATGVAMTAAAYEVGRDADATNQLHFNVPTGASMEWSVNDVAQLTLSAGLLQFGSVDTNIPIDIGLQFGATASAATYYMIRKESGNTPDALGIALGTESRTLYITENGDQGTGSLAQQTNPTLSIQSADATAQTERLTLTHNQTNGVIATGLGDIVLQAAGSDVLLLDSAGTSFGFIYLGGTSSSYPTIKRDGSSVDFGVGGRTGYDGNINMMTFNMWSAKDARNITSLGSTTRANATCSGAATATAANVIPDGAFLFGITTRVTTILADAGPITGYTVGDGATAAQYGTVVGVAVGTTTDPSSALGGSGLITALSTVTITFVGSTCTTGVISVQAHYMTMSAATAN